MLGKQKTMIEEGKRLNDRIFIARKRACNENEEGILEAMNHYKTGEKLEDSDKIWKSLVDYNVEVLTKNKPRTERARIERELKNECVEFFVNIVHIHHYCTY